MSATAAYCPASAVQAVLDDAAATWPVDRFAAAYVEANTTVTATNEHGELNERFQLASVSKLLTAYVMLIAVEEGAFELDDPLAESVAATVRGLNAAANVPTIRQLLSHAGGVEFADWVQKKAPGTRRIYSSAGYEMLGAHLEAVTEIAFADYAAEVPNAALGTTIDFSGSEGHGFSASVNDLVTIVREFLDPKVISSQLRDEAWRVQGGALAGVVPGYGLSKPCDWGLGFEIHGGKHPHWLAETMPESIVGHFGQAGTFVWVHPDTRCGLIVLTDRPFGDWAKPLWAEFNARVWAARGLRGAEAGRRIGDV